LPATGVLDYSTRQKMNSLSNCPKPPSEGVTLSVNTDKSQYTLSETMTVYFKAYNSGSEPVILKFNSGCQTAYSIAGFNSANGQMCTSNLTEAVIKPQSPYYWETKHYLSQNKIPVGQYKLEGRILASNYALSGVAPTLITISDSGSGTNLPPVISGMDAPTLLSVGQTGTWTVKASDPENGPLSYSVTWGDEYINTSSQGIAVSPAGQFSQNTTFTHSYSSAGVYTVYVKVKDNAGLFSQTSATVNVGDTIVINPVNNPPKIVGFPGVQANIQAGQMVNFSWTATDADSDCRDGSDSTSMKVSVGENIGEIKTITVLSPNGGETLKR